MHIHLIEVWLRWKDEEEVPYNYLLDVTASANTFVAPDRASESES